MFDKVDEAEMMFIGSRMLPVRGRLANALLLMKDRHATADEVGQLTFELPFSRRMLASLVGARPESLSRAIRALEDDDVACFRGRKVIVSDLDQLLDEVEQQPSRSPAGA
jgi:CRP/FNR family transcriptional regulator